ncbi:anti-sigma factor [Cupriavidus pinatubonensis]|uniref:anti-sigma factor n=1 Tax=Cupriavidus pinatubonensis TaxID=248026 RepID=UPI00360FF8AB
MRLTRHPDLLDRMAAQYALGVLRGGARRRMEQLAREEPAVRAAIGHWQVRLSGMAELQPSAETVEAVWCGIEQRLGWKPVLSAGAAEPPWWQKLWAAPVFWRGAAAAMTVIAALAVGIGWQMTQRQPSEAAVMAVLNNAQSKPALLVSWDGAARQLLVQRLDDTALSGQQVLQLWALPEGGKPQSLGVIGRERSARLALTRFPSAVPALAVSVEPPGGSTNPDGPSGPVIFKGPLIHSPL